MKKFNKLFGIFTAVAVILGAGACSNFVGLGEEVDQQAPEITISHPQTMSCVTQGFNLTGNVTDNKGVTQINIVCNETKQNWKIENRKWYTKGETDADWTEVTPKTPSQAVYLNGEPTDYEFSVPIEVDTEGSIIDYTFDITTTDKMHNTGTKSKATIKVSVDKADPKVTVSKPALNTNFTALKDKIDPSKPDCYKLRDNKCLDKLINGLFEISGSQDEDNPYQLDIYLDNGEDFTAEPASVVYAHKTITDANVLRNWSEEFNVIHLENIDKTKASLVRVYIAATDKTLERTEKKVHGWFVLWPDADKPWVAPNFGDDSAYDNYETYPNYNIQGQAYDDDGLKTITVKIFSSAGGDPVKTETFDLSAKNEPYFSWSLKAPADKGNYYAEIEVIDMNGTQGDKVTKYFKVKDTNPPSLSITSPEAGESVLGNASGSFTITGEASDDGEVALVKVVKIAQGKESTQLNYLDATSTLWNQTQDSDGNKVYTLTLSDALYDAEKKINKYTFSKEFNLFTDFGVDGTENKKAGNQIFIFLAKDKGGESTVKSFSISGDTEAPSVSFNKLHIDTAARTVTEYDLSEEDLTLPTWNKNSSGAITDKVYVTGTWSDNSFDNWQSLSKINKVVVDWNGITGITVTMNADGTWQTNSFTPNNSTTASLSASLTDFGGNTKKTSTSFYIESNKPEWTRISSTSADGSYTYGTSANPTEILITMEFNKSVKFAGGSSDPVLTLNNSKKAYYVSGNGTSKHYYKYTVASGDDVDALNVTALTVNGNVWSDDSSELDMSTLPAGEKSLAGGRSICIDTVAPVISSISTSSAGGYYKAGKSVFAILTFSEKVNVTNAASIKLKLNSGSSVYADNATVTGEKTIMFTYTVKAGEDADPLSISSIDMGTAVVTDVAGNKLTSTALPSGNPFAAIKIDTTKPSAPVVTCSKSGTVYSDDGFDFTVAAETGASVEYSIDGGTSWSAYSGKVTLTDNGTYRISSRQTDIAGNLSDASQIKTSTTVTIDKGAVLTSISSTKSDGTYTYSAVESKGDVIPVILTFRKKVTVSSGAYLTLNVTGSPSRTVKAVFDSASSTDTVKYFNYTVVDGDACTTGLNVTAITGTFKDADNIDVTSYCGIPSDNNLINNRTIKVVTGIPVVQSVALSGTNLTITFNETISKGDASVTLTQSTTDYRAPAVLSAEKYAEYASTGIAAYYEEGTNGSSDLGVSDLSKKYVLKYDTASNASALTALFIAQDAHIVTVPVTSNAVTVSGNKLIFDLSGTYALPVKGATYTVSIPANLVVDDLSHVNGLDTTARTVKLAGIETPVIRINKSAESISGTTVTQPLTASVKIDCQTPGSTIYYVDGTKTSNTRTLSQTNLPKTGTVGVIMASDTSSNHTTPPAQPGTSSSEYTAAFTVGSSEASNYDKGYKVLIRARATTDNGTTWSADSYEAAFRSVVIIKASPSIYNYFWIRGGDAESGGVGTPGFPFSWNSKEYSKVRAMTKKQDGTWYWVTWNINTNGYVGFLSGDIPSDAATNGPKNWCWASCGWVALKEYYPVYPGESMTLPTTTSDGDNFNNILGNGRGGFGFQDKHKESR